MVSDGIYETERRQIEWDLYRFRGEWLVELVKAKAAATGALVERTGIGSLVGAFRDGLLDVVESDKPQPRTEESSWDHWWQRLSDAYKRYLLAEASAYVAVLYRSGQPSSVAVADLLSHLDYLLGTARRKFMQDASGCPPDLAGFLWGRVEKVIQRELCREWEPQINFEWPFTREAESREPVPQSHASPALISSNVPGDRGGTNDGRRQYPRFDKEANPFEPAEELLDGFCKAYGATRTQMWSSIGVYPDQVRRWKAGDLKRAPSQRIEDLLAGNGKWKLLTAEEIAKKEKARTRRR